MRLKIAFFAQFRRNPSGKGILFGNFLEIAEIYFGVFFYTIDL
jgi:hypothetical protein